MTILKVCSISWVVFSGAANVLVYVPPHAAPAGARIHQPLETTWTERRIESTATAWEARGGAGRRLKRDKNI